MTRLHLNDPGLRLKTVEYPTLEKALGSLTPDAHKPYTDVLVETDGRVTHVASRPVGEATWVVREKPVAGTRK